ncbi:MAG: hypothetical protein RLZZ182_790 [Pseudomonadota bacterium]
MTDDASPARGSLVLMPNGLDLGSGHEQDLRGQLPQQAIERAAGLAFWVVENAKTARGFLKRVQAIAPLRQSLQSLSMCELPRPTKGGNQGSGKGHGAPSGPAVADALQRLLLPALQGQDVGLLCEAGMPAVADPGSELVAQAHQLGLAVETWPGPSSLMLALAASGLGGQHFAFVGYLPVPADQRDARIRELEALSRRAGQTQLAIETPYRNAALMQALLAQLQPSTRLSVSCGIGLPGGWTRMCRVQQWRQTSVVFADRLPAVFAWLAA